MRLFPKMKVRRYGVLEKMNQKIPSENEKENGIRTMEKCRTACGLQPQRFGDHLEQRRSQHEPSAQRDEIF